MTDKTGRNGRPILTAKFGNSVPRPFFNTKFRPITKADAIANTGEDRRQ